MADMLQGMGPTQQGPSPDEIAAFEQMRAQLSPGELNAEMMAVAEQVDPAAVAELKAELQSMEVPPEIIAMLRQLVQEVMADPDNYPQIRQKYLSMGVDVEMLPEVLEPEFFAALDMALDQMRVGPSMGQMPAPMMDPMMMPQGFARGGIASLRPMAQELASAGRYGDTMLAHITPAEAQLLRSYGGSGSINPVTGLPEFFSLFKKIGRALKKFARSTVGKIVTGIVLYSIAGPLAAGVLGAGAPAAATAAVKGFVAGAGSNLLAGGDLKSSLKTGAISGLTAGAFTGVTGGRAAFQRTPTPAIVDSVPTYVAPGTEGLSQGYIPSRQPVPGSYIGETIATAPAGTFNFSALDRAAAPVASTASTAATSAPATDPVFYQPPPTPFDQIEAFDFGHPEQYLAQSNINAPTLRTALNNQVAQTSFQPPGGFFENVRDAFDFGEGKGFGQSMKDAFLPSGRKKTLGEALAEVKRDPEYQSFTAAEKLEVAKDMVARPPLTLTRKYLPLASAGLGIAALTGAFDEQEQEDVPEGWEDFAAGISPGAKLLSEQPGRYGLQFGGTQTTAAPYNPYLFYQPPRRAATGGIMSAYPRKNGHINGPGTGTSDDVPAMLSDGEFVFTAKAVRAMGDGSRRKGAKRMYALMRKLEGRHNG